MENLPEETELKLKNMEQEYDELQKNLEYVEVISDAKLYSFLKQKSDRLYGIVNLYKSLKEYEDIDLKHNIELTQEFHELLQKLKRELLEFEKCENQSIQIEITSKDDTNVFLNEVRSMFENYFKFTKTQYSSKQIDENSCAIEAQGFNVYDKLKCFSGIFKKNQFGKSNLLTVVVLEKRNQSFEIKPDDLLVETLKSSGAGGQHINKTESAVRITHLPTKISVKCEDQRSQTQNKERAMELLTKKIKQKFEKNEQKYIEIQRKSIKNAIFSSTPVFELDFDRNVAIHTNGKTLKLKDCLNGDLEKIFL